MAPEVDDAPQERRSEPPVVRHGGRRIADDPDLAALYERSMLDLSGQLNALRDHAEFSQDELALAAGMSPTTVQDIEKMRADIRWSTIVRWAFVAGFMPEIRFRRLSPRVCSAPRYSGVNPGASATSP
jgi:DNA-binding XRE family transcriptional regulator